jgi:ubiquinone/menaquinone biosynthesis C-methylase UbiE
MYDQFASDYDRFVNWENRLAVELPFIEKVLNPIQPTPGQSLKVLDSACGTGMHAIALAKRDFNVSGADLSAPMIERARANAADSAAQVRFEAAGFGGLAERFGANSFDALLCLGNSLPHILTAADLKAALEDFALCLRPGGVLLIQNRNFDAVMATHQRWMEPQVFVDERFEYLFQRFYDFEVDGTIQFNIVTLVRQRGGEWQASTTSTHLVPQKHADLQKALADTGFTQLQAYGSMGGEPFDISSSGNLILVARAQ